MAGSISGTKRRLKVEDKQSAELRVSEIEEDCGKAMIYGLITELSPVKKSKKNPQVEYFDGKLSDGQKSLRMVCFKKDLHSNIAKAKEEKSIVTLTNCRVKSSAGQNQLEILLTDTSRLLPATKSFDIDGIEVDTALKTETPAMEVSSLLDLDNIVDNQVITIVVKVVIVRSFETVTTKDGRILKKQDCTVADRYGTCRLVLWEEDIEKLEEKKSYRLKNVAVRSFENTKYLSFSRKTDLEVVEDIGEVNIDDDLVMNEDKKQVFEGEVVSILSFDNYWNCNACYNGRVNQVYSDDEIGRREKEEIEKQNRLAMQRAKSASVEADIKKRVRIEEEERCKIRHEIDRKRSLEKEFENFLNYKKNRTQ
jgi:hypothetical protein